MSATDFPPHPPLTKNSLHPRRPKSLESLQLSVRLRPPQLALSLCSAWTPNGSQKLRGSLAAADPHVSNARRPVFPEAMTFGRPRPAMSQRENRRARTPQKALATWETLPQATPQNPEIAPGTLLCCDTRTRHFPARTLPPKHSKEPPQFRCSAVYRKPAFSTKATGSPLPTAPLTTVHLNRSQPLF